MPAKRQRLTRPREEILEATLIVIADHGVAAAQIADIAAAVGISPGGLLYHFGSRQELLSAALRYKDQRWFESLGTDPDRTAQQSISSLITMLLAPTSQASGLWRRDWMVWFEAAVASFHNDDVRTSIVAQESRWTAIFATALASDEQFNGATSSQVAAAANTISSLVDGLALRLVVNAEGLTSRQAVQLAQRTVTALANEVRAHDPMPAAASPAASHLSSVRRHVVAATPIAATAPTKS